MNGKLAAFVPDLLGHAVTDHSHSLAFRVAR